MELPAVSATTVTAVTTTAAAAAAAVTAASAAAATAALTRSGFVDADHATHPFDVLEIVNRFLLVFVAVHLNETEAALTTCFTVEGEAGALHFAVLAEQVKQVLLLSLEGEIADVDGHFLLGPMDI